MKPNYYQAVLMYQSRGLLRGGISWSTKQCKKALEDMGYKPRPAYLGHNYIWMVQFDGTRKEVLQHRRTISNRLRVLSSRRIAIRFNYTQPGEQDGQRQA